MFGTHTGNFEKPVNPDTKAAVERDGERETHKQNIHGGKLARRMGNGANGSGRMPQNTREIGRGRRLAFGRSFGADKRHPRHTVKCGAGKRYGF